MSAETIAVLREEAFARGAVEVHAWTKAHLEDMLFQPENDHLLFAYFGLSLRVGQRSEVPRIRSTITIKNKVARALKAKALDERIAGGVLIRDSVDAHYPYWLEVPGFAEMEPPPWHMGEVWAFHPNYLLISQAIYDGWVKETGEWDIIGRSSRPTYLLGQDYWSQVEDSTHIYEKRPEDVALHSRVPEAEQRTIRRVALLPYTNIVDVDPLGDCVNAGPHIYCSFDDLAGPYSGVRWFVASRHTYGQDIELQNENRAGLFTSLQATGSADEPGQ